MTSREILSTKKKALNLNIKSHIYGTIAEIGGGQEVARTFFQAGGASGTIAKTISAYDKTFSDYLYNQNKPGRYVSEARLEKMMNREFKELYSLLSPIKNKNTLFFAFANTVETLNYQKTNKGHGWLGVKFQLSPESEPNEVIIHANLLENDGILQQYTLGTLGVNLIYACYHYYNSPNTFLQSLMDNLDRHRVEINMARMTGPDFDYVDNRLLSLQLVKNKMTHAVIFDRKGKVQQPSDLLYKKNILAFRGSFRPITYVGFDMLKSSFGYFKKEIEYSKETTLALCEMTLNNLLDHGNFDEKDFLDRVDILNGMGQNVMVSDIREYYKLNKYFNQFKVKEIRLVVGAHTLEKITELSYYQDLKGGILEAFGYLFTKNTKLYVYPSLLNDENKLLNSKTIKIPNEIKILYDYLLQSNKIIDLINIKKENLTISSQKVLKLIHERNPDWEKMVPVYISESIKNKKLFGYS